MKGKEMAHKVNTSIVKLWDELDQQQGRLQMLACEIGFNSSDNEAKKSKELMLSLLASKYESNLKLVREICRERL